MKEKNKGPSHTFWKGYGEISGKRWWQITKKHKKNEVNIDIKFAWELFLKQNRKCALSGKEIYFAKTSREKFTASLDRIDNKRGYEKGNVQWVHKKINKSKSDFTQEEYINMCKHVTINHLKEKKKWRGPLDQN